MLKILYKGKEDYYYAVFRILIGLLFMQHGAQKLFGWLGGPGLGGFTSLLAKTYPLAIVLAVIIAAIEFFGGLFIALGLFTRIAAFFAGLEMLIEVLIVYFVVHHPQGIFPINNGGELPLLFLAAMLVIYSRGAKKWSLQKYLPF